MNEDNQENTPCWIFILERGENREIACSENLREDVVTLVNTAIDSGIKISISHYQYFTKKRDALFYKRMLELFTKESIDDCISLQNSEFKNLIPSILAKEL